MKGRFRSYFGLAAISAGALFSFSRVFAGTDWIPPVFGALASALAVAALLDRLKAPGPLRTLLSAMGAMWFVAIFIVPDATTFGLPNPARLIQIGRVAFQEALDATTLLDPSPGVLMLAVAAAWFGIIVSEQVAVAGHPILTALPWLGLFSLASSTGAPGGRAVSVLAFFTGFLVELFLVRLPQEDGTWPAGMQKGAAARNVWGAGVLGGIAAASALFVPQIIPGYRSPAWFANQLQGPSSQTVVSPLVQIQPQLHNPAPRKLFEVRTNGLPGPFVYWRLVALDDFDGKAWGTSSEYRRVRGNIAYSTNEVFGGPSVPLSQRYLVNELGGPWMPAAYQVTKVSGAETSVDPLSSSLVARRRVSSGIRYTVESRIPSPSPDHLKNAPTPVGLDTYTTLVGVSEQVKQIAQTWTNGKTTAYEKVVALSDRLRRFRYDESVPPGHSADHLLKFLTVTRAGYCEQFAASMAVLVRAVGIPSRVAVGFVQGDYDQAAEAFSVLTTHAHAWPEVYFAGVGWVPFEPTPRSGVALPSYAGGAQPLDVPQAEEVPAEIAAEPAAPSPPPESPAPSPPPPQTQENKVVSRLLLIVLAIAAVALVTLASIAIGKRARRSSRYKRANTAADRVRAAYLDFEDRVIDLWSPRQMNQTPAEFVSETRSRRRLDIAPTTLLLGAFEKSAFAPQGPSDDEAREALTAAALLTAQLWDGSGWSGRLGILLSPRSLLTRSPKRV